MFALFSGLILIACDRFLDRSLTGVNEYRKPFSGALPLLHRLEFRSLPWRMTKVTNHRLKAVALVTGCKPCSEGRQNVFPHQAGFKK